jgi:hypothetical protein
VLVDHVKEAPVIDHGRYLSRRRFLGGAALAGGAAALAACAPSAGGPTAGPTGSVATAAPATPVPTVTSPSPTPDSAATVLVRDVVEYELRGPYAWNGGSVTLRLHAGFIDGDTAYFVRTDTSDRDFAEQEGLVWVPILSTARSRDGAVGTIRLVEGGVPDQLPILSTVPGRDDFTPLYRVVRVAFTGNPILLDSAAAVAEAASAGSVAVEETAIIVNYPTVQWPGGVLPVDTAVELPLAGGPLLDAPDLDGMVVTFKLHQCYPESRYIITDTSAVPMAPMMNIQGSPGTAGLDEVGAVSTITVFGNGIPGPGAMGFQPGIFREKAGDPAWSPLWDHFTAVWKDPTKAVLVTNQADLNARVAAGEIEIFRATPDTGGQGFIVNCPSPIIAPNDFEVTTS